MKRCSKCQQDKLESEFFERSDRPGSFRSQCKKCMQSSTNKENKRQFDRDYYLQNREKKLSQSKAYAEANSEKVKAYHKSILPRKMEQRRDRYKTDLNYKLTCNLRSRLHCALKRNKKTAHTLELLGCSIEQLKNHLEAQFVEGMSWEKVMNGEIHIDHIRPCSSFDLTQEAQQKECFHFTNLQPLWAIENFKKSYKIL